MEKEPKVVKDEYVEHMPEIIPTTVDNVQNEFLYGKSIERLDYNTALRNKPSSGSPYANSVSYTTTGVKTVTGVGFMPSIIKIKANTATSFSDGIYDGS